MGPEGAQGRAPSSGTASRVPTDSDPSDVRCPEYATTRRPPSHRYHRFFSSLSLSLYFSPFTHFTGSARPVVLSSSSQSLPHLILGPHGKPVARGRRRRPLSNFRISRETSFALCILTAVRKKFTHKYKCDKSIN